MSDIVDKILKSQLSSTEQRKLIFEIVDLSISKEKSMDFFSYEREEMIISDITYILETIF